MNRLDGKVAIVTAAGRGIGRGIALTFAREGAHVIVASLGKEECDQTVKDIEALGGSAKAVPTNVGERDQVFALIDASVKEFGRLDILVNAAQSYGTARQPSANPIVQAMEDFDEKDIEWTFQTGAMGTYWAMKAAFPHLSKHGGKIINFGSIFGQMGQEGLLAYAMTKESIRAMSRVAAREWARHRINVNVINPAARTDTLEAAIKANPDLVAENEKKIPMGRYGDPERDIAPVALFLASADSDYVTGMTFQADGGMYIHP